MAVVWPTVVAKDPKVEPVAVECEAGPAAPQLVEAPPAEPKVEPAEPKVEPAELVEMVFVVPSQAHLRPSLAHLAPPNQAHLVPSPRAHQAHRRHYHQLLLLRKMLQVSALFEDSVCTIFLLVACLMFFFLCALSMLPIFFVQYRCCRYFLPVLVCR